MCRILHEGTSGPVHQLPESDESEASLSNQLPETEGGVETDRLQSLDLRSFAFIRGLRYRNGLPRRLTSISPRSPPSIHPEHTRRDSLPGNRGHATLPRSGGKARIRRSTRICRKHRRRLASRRTRAAG